VGDDEFEWVAFGGIEGVIMGKTIRLKNLVGVFILFFLNCLRS